MTEYSFPRILAALCELMGVPESQAPAIKGRLDHLKRLGFLPRTGAGLRATYGFEHAFKLALALEFENFGTNPKDIAGCMMSIFADARIHERALLTFKPQTVSRKNVDFDFADDLSRVAKFPVGVIAIGDLRTRLGSALA